MGCGESKISVANTIVLGVSNTFSLLIKSFLKVTECKELCFGRSFLRDVVHHGGEEMAEGRGGMVVGREGFGLGGHVAYTFNNQSVNSKWVWATKPDAYL